MRISVLVALLGAAALVPTAANAQDHHGRSDRGSHSESRGDRGGGERRSAPERPSFQRQSGQRPTYTPQARADRGNWRPGNNPSSHFENDRGVARADRDFTRPGGDFNRDRGARADYRPQDHRGGNGDFHDQRGDRYRGGYDRDRGHYQAYNRDWHNDRRYDWRDYRARNRYAYRLPRYYAPYGWDRGYRRFSIGFTLSSVLFGENYWISDPYEYRLPPAYGPYRWVRYYNDALLVDIDTGQVVDVVYDIFW